jgi:hypothetical protein
VHFGVAYPAANGVAGQAPVEVSRLVQWPPLKRVLAENTDVNLILILSDRLFAETVKQGHTSYNVDDFVRVHVREKEFDGEAWVWSPDHDVRLLTYLARRGQNSSGEREPSPGHSFTQKASVINTFAERVDAREANFGVIGERGK